MNFLFPIDQTKIIVVDPETSPFLPKAVISPYITTPITNSLIAVTPNPDLKPVITMPLLPQLNLNLDPNVHDSVTNTIYRKVFDSWIYKNDYEGLLKYIKIVNGEAKLATGKDGDRSNDSGSIERKIRFLKDNILSRNRVKSILEDFVSATKTNWYDIEKNNYFVKDLIYRYMKKKLKALVELKGK